VLEVITVMSTKQAVLAKESRCGVKGDALWERNL